MIMIAHVRNLRHVTLIIIITRARAQFSANHEMTACYVAFLKKHNSATTGIATVW